MTSWMIRSVLTSALVATAAAALDRVASLMDAPRRFVWMGAIAVAVIAPVVLGLRRAPAAPSPLSVAATVGRNPERLSQLSSSNGVVTAPPIASTTSATAGRDRWRAKLATWPASTPHADEVCIAAWIAASLGLFALFIVTVLRLRLQRDRWRTTDTEIGLVYTAPDVGPAVFGFFRPRIVLPHWALAMEGRARSLLLRHELEHVRAGDARTIIAAELVTVALPWNVPVWWMVHRLRLAVEMDCDARVLKGSDDAYEYGSMLLAVGERHAAGLPLAASLLEPRSALEVRIAAIAAPRRRRPLVAAFPLLSVAGLALSAIAWTPIPRSSLRAPVPVPVAPRPHPAGDAQTVERHVDLDRDSVRVGSGRTRSIAVVAMDRASAAGVASEASAPQSPAPVVDAPEPLRIQNDDSLLTAVGYFDRKKSGSGFFIDGAMIDRQSARFSDAMRPVPGLRISPRPDNRGFLIEDANVQPHGCVNTFVDGILWAPPSDDLDEYLKPAELLAVERYRRAEVPRQFSARDGSQCATLVVWTRALEKRHSTRGE